MHCMHAHAPSMLIPNLTRCLSLAAEHHYTHFKSERDGIKVRAHPEKLQSTQEAPSQVTYKLLCGTFGLLSVLQHINTTHGYLGAS